MEMENDLDLEGGGQETTEERGTVPQQCFLLCRPSVDAAVRGSWFCLALASQSLVISHLTSSHVLVIYR